METRRAFCRRKKLSWTRSRQDTNAEVKKFIFDQSFCEILMKLAAKTYLARAGHSDQDRLIKKCDQTEKQIQVFAERISVLLEVDLEKEKNLKPDSPIELAHLEDFKERMKQYIEAAEADHHIKSAIMKIIVHKIEIKPNGLEIFFNVGENHYKEALGETPIVPNQLLNNRKLVTGTRFLIT